MAANLGPDAFAGTAAAYLRYRPPYPRALLDDLVHRAAGRDVLVDLACGPGRIALDLAGAFTQVHANDIEPEMIATGKAEAARRGIGNVAWSIGPAEACAFSDASVDLITIGEAFHRVDQAVVVRNALRWLKPGGAFATLGPEGFLHGAAPWRKALAEVARRWIARVHPSGVPEGRPGNDLGPGMSERVLRRAGFRDVEQRRFSEPCDWTFAELLGYLRSTSVCSERRLGTEFAALAEELACVLGAGERRVFHEDLRYSYTIGWR